MSRYEPSAEERTAINLLRLAGYAVVRQRTYDDLRERVRLASAMESHAKEDAENARAWALDQCAEQRRLSDRLNEVCFAAASEGVSIQAINHALEKVRP